MSQVSFPSLLPTPPPPPSPFPQQRAKKVHSFETLPPSGEHCPLQLADRLGEAQMYGLECAEIVIYERQLEKEEDEEDEEGLIFLGLILIIKIKI